MDRFLQDPESEKLLNEHSRALETAEALKGMQFKPTMTRDELLQRFKSRKKASKSQSRGRGSANTVDVSFAPPIYPPCLAPLKGLNKIMVKDLLLETHHRGSYILLRSITQADKVAAITVIVEDEQNHAIPLQMLNEKLRCQDGSVDKGQILLVKEPYLTLTFDAEYGVKVDHVSDIMFISMSDKMVPSAWRERLPEDETSQWMAGDWLSMGTEYLNRGKFYSATEYYSKALECSPTEEETHYLLYYRGLAFFQVDEWDASLRDLDAVPAGPESEKALRGKAQTLYRLKRFRESCDVFTKLCKKHPEDVGARNDFREAIARFAEQKKGGYKFKKMQEKASKTYPPLLDHAAWIGPVTVRQTKSQGRGLFTTEAVKAGDLLLCEKAFAYATEHPSRPRWSSTLHINTETRTITRGGQAALASSIIETLYKNPSLAPAVTDLHSSGSKQVSTGPVDGKPVIDTFQIACIISLNSFGSPTSSGADHIHDACDASRNPDALHNCGIWPYASAINHSCMSNAHRAFIGDMMIIRAAVDIPANTELKIWYLLPAPEHQPMDFRHWGFECCCAICADVSVTEPRVLETRVRQRAQIAMALENGSNGPSLTRAETLIERLAETYPHPLEQVLRLGLWEPLILIAGVYERQKRPEEAGEAVNRALAAVGFVLEGSGLEDGVEGPLVVKKWGLPMDDIVVALLLLRRSLLEVAPERAMQVERYARMAYLICVGEEESFDTAHGMSLKVACELCPKEGQVEGWVI
ncbi:Tetratricopeptide-like helical [Penicillium concentricum]|uniref:Tetratricopeptide-like helical n=1 Tax=Penicillium concentricum TaxID=293559 RepID=A0A9W9SUG6_9EURO|nr:Tetratricopeptide-like helical [Penicillium concentricum]KAJ5384888.1 Tetratricopeptide-like helical [Penicillium concentricum]